MPEMTAPLFDVAPFTTAWRLHERFTIPPFSVLDTKAARWRELRARWNELDLDSGTGRGDQLTFRAAAHHTDAISVKINGLGSTSIFDPVLCELVYRWWSPADGLVLDPFAGGSVRGVVASILGRRYRGVDLSAGQVAANYDTAARVAAYLGPDPKWTVGDSCASAPPVTADLVFTCPPYGNLERYSDDPADLSTMDFAKFSFPYMDAIGLACDRLRDDRFAVFVVGNYRERGGDGHLNDLVALTGEALREAGLRYYADLALLNSTASAGARASATFNVGRKPIMVHQHVLVYVKGDWRKAAAAAERIDQTDIPQEGEPGVDLVSEEGAR